MHTHGPGCLHGPLWGGQQWKKTASSAGEEETEPSKEHRGRPSEKAPIRKDLVERVRREIEAGTYDTPEKWEAALEKLLKRLEQE